MVCVSGGEKKGPFVKKKVTSSKHEKEGGEDYAAVDIFIRLPKLGVKS